MRFNLICCGPFWVSAKDVIKHFPKAKLDIYDFLNNLSASPGSGDPVPGYEGKIFKERWALKSYNIGARGGLRVYYYFQGQIVAPFFIYAKKQFTDAPKELIARLVKDIQNDLMPSES